MSTKTIPNKGTESKQVLFRKALRLNLQVLLDETGKKFQDLTHEELEALLLQVKHNEKLLAKMPSKEAFVTQFNITFKKELLQVAKFKGDQGINGMDSVQAHLHKLPDDGPAAEPEADDDDDNYYRNTVLSSVRDSQVKGLFRHILEGFDYQQAVDDLIAEGLLVEKKSPAKGRAILYTTDQDKQGYGGWASTTFPPTPGCVVIVDMHDPFGPRIISEHVSAQVAGRIRDQQYQGAKLLTAADYEALPYKYAGEQAHPLLSARLESAQAVASTIQQQSAEMLAPLPAPVLGLDALADLNNQLSQLKRGDAYHALVAKAQDAGYSLYWMPYGVTVRMVACHDSMRVVGEQWGLFKSEERGTSSCLLSLLGQHFEFRTKD